MKRFVSTLCLCALACAAAAGCGKSSSPSAPAPPQGTIADIENMLASAVVAGTVLPTNADSTASLLATMDVGGLRAASGLLLVGGHLANGGTMSTRVNAPVGPGTTEVTLDRLAVYYAGSWEYAYTTLKSHPLGVDLTFDASTFHRFTVSGAAGFPAFVDSVRSVPMILVSAPLAGATVTRSGGLEVQWSDAGVDTTVYVNCLVTSLVDSTYRAAGVLARDVNGSLVVPAARLSLLPAGAARLAVTRYRLSYPNAGRKVGLASAATDVRALTLN